MLLQVRQELALAPVSALVAEPAQVPLLVARQAVAQKLFSYRAAVRCRPCHPSFCLLILPYTRLDTGSAVVRLTLEVVDAYRAAEHPVHVGVIRHWWLPMVVLVHLGDNLIVVS